MLKKKHVVLHTDADLAQAQGMLESQTVRASSMPDHPVETLKDTFSVDQRPFRGEVGAGAFKLTRRRRGRNVRIQLQGTLEPNATGGTDIKASMSAPRTLLAGLIAGMAAVGIIGGGVALGDMPMWAGLFMLAGEGLALTLASKLYKRETSRTFSALRDAIPARAPQAVAPVSEPAEQEHAAARDQLRQG